MDRRDRVVKIACDLYNREYRRYVTPGSFDTLDVSTQQFLLVYANEVLTKKEKHESAFQTAEEDHQFLEEHPVNGDIDLSPYPLLRV